VRVSLNEVQAGTPVSLSASADDTRYDSNGWGDEPVQPVAAARYSLDFPSWKPGVQTYPLQPLDGEFNSPQEDLNAVLDTTGWSPGRHIIFVESQDAAGNWGCPLRAFLMISFEPSAYLPLLFNTSPGE
jgi:hypothetical protein